MSDFKTQADIERYLLKKESNKVINSTGAIVFYQNKTKVVTNKLGLKSNEFEIFSGYFNPVFWSKYTQPQLIIVNGVECPAPISSLNGMMGIYIPVVGSELKFQKININSHNEDYVFDFIANGLAYANKEDAIARAKAMIIKHPAPL